MSLICVNGYKIKVVWYEGLLPLWDFEGKVRAIPRNIYSLATIQSYFLVALCMLPIAWLLSHVPFFWPEFLGGMVGILCVCIGVRPYQDPFRAIVALILAQTFLYFHVNLDVTILGFHIEKYLYYIVTVAAIFTLWRRFFNWLCWRQIDSMCEKYGIPKYDQKTLMDDYEGYNTHYGEKHVGYASYQEAINAKESQKNPVE